SSCSMNFCRLRTGEPLTVTLSSPMRFRVRSAEYNPASLASCLRRAACGISRPPPAARCPPKAEVPMSSAAQEAGTAIAAAEESNEPKIGEKDKLEELCVNTIRFLAVDAVEKAKSGHPGSPMGMADMAFVLWTEFLRHDPDDPQWRDRDRFVLSAGHASMLLYSLLHLTGYKDMTIDQLTQFRQWVARTAGRPED